MSGPKSNYGKCALCLALAASYISIASPARAGKPIILVGYGQTLHRFAPNGQETVFEFGSGFGIVGMAVVPPGANVVECAAGDVVAVRSVSSQAAVWKVNGVTSTPTLQRIGFIPAGGGHEDIVFAQGQLFGISDNLLYTFNTTDFAQIGAPLDLRPNETCVVGGLALDRVNTTWYLLNSVGNKLIKFVGATPTASTWDEVGYVGQPFSKTDLEWFDGELWGALQSANGTNGQIVRVGTFDLVSGTFTSRHSFDGGSTALSVGLALVPSCPADFNGDLTFDFFDYLDFVAAFAANDPAADFNADTVIDFFDYLDFVESFASGC